MNGTFTIESVHGIKQTFVLGPTVTVDATASLGENASEQDRKESRDESPNRSR